MNDETNWGPRSEMTFREVPCNLKIESQNIVATPLKVMVSIMGKRWIILENRFMMTSMVFLPSDCRRGPIRSMEMIFQGEDGISLG